MGLMQQMNTRATAGRLSLAAQPPWGHIGRRAPRLPYRPGASITP